MVLTADFSSLDRQVVVFALSKRSMSVMVCLVVPLNQTLHDSLMHAPTKHVNHLSLSVASFDMLRMLDILMGHEDIVTSTN